MKKLKIEKLKTMDGQSKRTRGSPG